MIKEYYIKSSTGKNLYVKKWFDENITKYKGIVQLVHGMEEFIDRYDNFALYLANKGYLVVGHDHLGHGKSVESDKELGDFGCENGWFHLAEDIHIIQNKTAKENPNLPYIIFGHSMGSLLVRTYATIYKDNIKGIILSGTSGQKKLLHAGVFLASTMKLFKGGKAKSKFLAKMVGGSFNKKFKPNRTDGDWLTRDEKIIDDFYKIANPNRKFTIESYLQMMKGSIYLNNKNNLKNTINVPILLISGDKDPVGEDGKGVKRVYNTLKEVEMNDVQIKLYEGARHEILNEINKDEIYQFILNWIEKNI